MKKNTVFKVIYYGFTVVMGIILAILLPTYNKYSKLESTMNKNLSKQEYDKIAGYFAAYYNGSEVYKGESNNAKAYIYETITYDTCDSDGSYYYCQTGYMGFIFDFDKNYGHDDLTDVNGNKYNYSGVYADGIKFDFSSEAFYYLNDMSFVYFEITTDDMRDNNITSVNDLVIKNNAGDVCYTFNNLNLNFSSDFLSLAYEYQNLFNEAYTLRELEINGNATFDGTKTSVGNGTTFKYNAYTQSKVYISVDEPTAFSVSGGTLEDSKYKMSTGEEITFTALKDTTINYIEVSYDRLIVRYDFTGDTKYVTFDEPTTINGTYTLNTGYNKDKQNSEYDAWKAKYNYQESTVSNVVKGTGVKSVFEIVLFAVIMLIIGDFLVGKHYILNLFRRLFKKEVPNKEIETIKNEYEVNVAASAFVPVGYTQPIKVTYEHENGSLMIIELDKSTNYKMTKRYPNGNYKLKDVQASGAHMIKVNSNILVRGYRFELLLNFALDEVDEPSITNN